MSKFIMLVGLPGSGKSKFANELSEQNGATILSSDDIREEILNDVNDQSNNVEVFQVMNKRTKQLLNEGKDVIYDATNINRKRRIHLINHEIKADEKIVYYISEHPFTCKYYDHERQRTVGHDVIDKMYKNLQIPLLNEGWDEVLFIQDIKNDMQSTRKFLESSILIKQNHDKLFENLSVINEFRNIIDLPQDSSYHSFSVSRHIYYVYDYIYNNYNNADLLMMLWTSLFHDLGKGFCKSFYSYKGELKRYANFIGHEYVSSQLAVYWLNRLGYDDQFIKDVATLVQFHMMPMKASDKKMKEVNELLGDDLFEKLLILHEADTKAK